VPEDRRIGLAAAAAAVRRGALVVVPTDAAYAVVCDAFRPDATARLREAKGRPPEAPLTALIANSGVLDALGYGVSEAGRDLAAALWPGPLTLVVRQQPSLLWDVDPGTTVGVRMPLHPVALELLAMTGPLASTGANLAGMPVPLDCESAERQLGETVAVYLDAGPMSTARASAVVDASVDPPVLVRQGSVEVDHLQRVCPALAVVTEAG
jgi:L-threonylcarbamoyladenylate synthase